jgi:hypothetical protein
MNSLIQRNSVGILDLERAWLWTRLACAAGVRPSVRRGVEKPSSGYYSCTPSVGFSVKKKTTGNTGTLPLSSVQIPYPSPSVLCEVSSSWKELKRRKLSGDLWLCRLGPVRPPFGLQPQHLDWSRRSATSGSWLWCLDLGEHDSASAPPTSACFSLANHTGRSLDGIGGRQRVNLEEVPSGASAGLTPRGGEEEMPRWRGGGDATVARRSIGEAARTTAARRPGARLRKYHRNYRRTSSLTSSAGASWRRNRGKQLLRSMKCFSSVVATPDSGHILS